MYNLQITRYNRFEKGQIYVNVVPLTDDEAINKRIVIRCIANCVPYPLGRPETPDELTTLTDKELDTLYESNLKWAEGRSFRFTRVKVEDPAKEETDEPS